MKFFLFVLLLTGFVNADDALVQVPDSCLQKKITPCLVKAKNKTNLKWIDAELTFSKETLIETSLENEVARIDVLSGFLKVKSTRPYKVFGYEIKTDLDQYVSVYQGGAQILDLETFDLKRLVFENPAVSTEKIYVLQRSDFLNRKELVEYLSFFYSNATDLKKTLRRVSMAYQKKLLSESKKQAQFIKQKQDREIASIEFAEKQRKVQELQEHEDRKRSRELFFMRTFKR